MVNKFNDKKVADIFDKCSIAHAKLQGNLEDVKKCLDEAKQLFQFYLKCSISTRIIKDQIDSIESQIAQALGVYDPVSDVDRATRVVIENLHSQLFLLQEHKEKIIKQYNKLCDMVSLRLTSFTKVLADAEKIVQKNLVSSSSKEGEDFHVQLESQCHMLAFSKKDQDVAKKDWEVHLAKLKVYYKDILPSSS